MPLLVNGRPLKGLNQGYNKRRAQLQSQLTDDQSTSRALNHLTDHRSAPCCPICTPPAGLLSASSSGRHWHPGDWEECRLEAGGPPGQAKQPGVRLHSACPLHRVADLQGHLGGHSGRGMEESYTSKCSFLDLEPVTKQEVYAGNLSSAASSRQHWALSNADVNGLTIAQGVSRRLCPWDRSGAHPSENPELPIANRIGASSPERHVQRDSGCCGQSAYKAKRVAHARNR